MVIRYHRGTYSANNLSVPSFHARRSTAMRVDLVSPDKIHANPAKFADEDDGQTFDFRKIAERSIPMAHEYKYRNAKGRHRSTSGARVAFAKTVRSVE